MRLVDLLLLAAAGCLTTAGALVAPALGFAVAGLSILGLWVLFDLDSEDES